MANRHLWRSATTFNFMRSLSPYERYGIATPNTEAALRMHVYVVTDTVSAIAERYYGDWRMWRLIAERNQIDDVRTIEPGTELIIPRRPLRTGAFESA